MTPPKTHVGVNGQFLDVMGMAGMNGGAKRHIP
jgi:hypothetical protein